MLVTSFFNKSIIKVPNNTFSEECMQISKKLNIDPAKLVKRYLIHVFILIFRTLEEFSVAHPQEEVAILHYNHYR